MYLNVSGCQNLMSPTSENIVVKVSNGALDELLVPALDSVSTLFLDPDVITAVQVKHIFLADRAPVKEKPWSQKINSTLMQGFATYIKHMCENFQ